MNNSKRERNIIWLSGDAGTGKSAVAQTFAELCAEQHRLGAAFFFSRPSGRNDPNTVVPSIAYQLAMYLPVYRSLLANHIARDFTILDKTPRIQLTSLIIEPLSILQMQRHRISREPLVIVLDGLDECLGIDAQCEIVEMIGEVVRLKLDFPLLWLILSRPEPHLEYIFSRSDFPINSHREKLLVDAETRDDVGRYLHDSFGDIRARFSDITTASWPSDLELRWVLDIAGGLFVLASTIIRYVGDPMHESPMGRLTHLLNFIGSKGKIGATSPLETLDLLYSQILNDVPQEILPTTRRLLLPSVHQTVFTGTLSSVQVLCNFLRVDQTEFNRALRKLHAMLDIPSPEASAENPVRVYHATFGDYLRNPARSGRFSISEQDVYLEYAEICLSWYKTILDLLPVSDGAVTASQYHSWSELTKVL